MNHNVMQLEEKKKTINFSHSVLGNYFIELDPGNYQAKEASNELDTQFEILQFS